MISGQQECFEDGTSSRRSAATSREPIDLLLQEQERVRIVAGMMSILADDLWQRGRECYAHSVLSFFKEEWPLRVDDEEYSLMPRLLARQGATETARRMQTTLGQNHDLIRHAVTDIEERLCALMGGVIPIMPATFSVNLIRAEELVRQHMDWEEQTFFPWARKRLMQPDMAAIWREMTERRGLSHLR
ncbi:MAG: hypothetical protein GEU92_01100 [Alphaproteobacteria bacterium]|nr:hypothetical protein [Alphaproteobacteria bacterium]